MRTYIKDLKVGKEVILNGWLHEIRDLAKIKFLLLRDRTGIIQCVVLSDNQETFDLVPKLKQEMAVEIKGKVVENKVAKLGYEVQVDSVEVLGDVLQVLPIQVVEKGEINTDLSTRLDYRFLDLRKPEIQKIFQVRDSIYKTTVDFFTKQGFIAVNTPKMTSAGVESGADMFTIDYFGTKAYLSQSPQIYKQMLVCSGFEKVFEIGTVFRAEKSNTSRHQTEFTGVDFEMGFVKNLSEIMDVTEAYLKEVLKNLEDIGVALPGKIPRIEMVELKKMLKDKGKELGENEDLDSESEQLVGDLIKEKHGCDFVFVINYPWEKRPFYHVKNGNGTKSFDLLFKGVEIATGSLREHRYEVLKEQAKEKDVDLDAMEDYVLLFKCGAPPHGGCGLGLDRIAQRLLGLDNVREVVFLPRDPDRLRP